MELFTKPLKEFTKEFFEKYLRTPRRISEVTTTGISERILGILYEGIVGTIFKFSTGKPKKKFMKVFFKQFL